MDEIVRDATMMGATIIQPVVTAHTAVKPAFAKRGENVERWRRIAIASAKQSRRATLPDVREPGRSRSRLVGALGGSRIDVRGAVSRP